jgi:branched-chain amino acid transport system permease protein
MTGLLIGGVYALMSVGLALIFGIMKVVNFAQGDFMVVSLNFRDEVWSAEYHNIRASQGTTVP